MTSCIRSAFRFRWLRTLIVAVGSVLGTDHPLADDSGVSLGPEHPAASRPAVLRAATMVRNRRRAMR
jgi:hypothetical protein